MVTCTMEEEKKSVDDHHIMIWEPYLEDLLAKWSNHALTYAWLHTKAEEKYRKINYWFTIPIVVLSTITGTINVGMSSLLPADYIHYGQIGVGCVGIFTGILGTLQNFFKYAQLSESHRNAGIQWYKFHRNVHTELALDSQSRKNAGECFRYCKSEMDRLLDNSPYIPTDTVVKYSTEHDKEIELPDIIGHLHRTPIYRKPDELDKWNVEELPVVIDPE